MHTELFFRERIADTRSDAGIAAALPHLRDGPFLLRQPIYTMTAFPLMTLCTMASDSDPLSPRVITTWSLESKVVSPMTTRGCHQL